MTCQGKIWMAPRRIPIPRASWRCLCQDIGHIALLRRKHLKELEHVGTVLISGTCCSLGSNQPDTLARRGAVFDHGPCPSRHPTHLPRARFHGRHCKPESLTKTPGKQQMTPGMIRYVYIYVDANPVVEIWHAMCRIRK